MPNRRVRIECWFRHLTGTKIGWDKALHFTSFNRRFCSASGLLNNRPDPGYASVAWRCWACIGQKMGWNSASSVDPSSDMASHTVWKDPCISNMILIQNFPFQSIIACVDRFSSMCAIWLGLFRPQPPLQDAPCLVVSSIRHNISMSPSRLKGISKYPGRWKEAIKFGEVEPWHPYSLTRRGRCCYTGSRLSCSRLSQNFLA